MFKCDSCGRTYSEDELPTFTEDYGYDTGIGWLACPQTFVESCSCGGEFEEATMCEDCGNYFLSDEIYNARCEDCLSENMTLENALLVGAENKEKIEINGYLADEFTADQINEILKRELMEAQRVFPGSLNYKRYLQNDISYFADWLDKEQKKGSDSDGIL
jgi:hypothetical protein